MSTDIPPEEAGRPDALPIGSRVIIFYARDSEWFSGSILSKHMDLERNCVVVTGYTIKFDDDPQLECIDLRYRRVRREGNLPVRRRALD